jgi:hypothetical protein
VTPSSVAVAARQRDDAKPRAIDLARDIKRTRLRRIGSRRGRDQDGYEQGRDE